MFKFGIAMCTLVLALPTYANEAAIQKWIKEFSPSTLSKEQQIEELRWFAKKGKAFQNFTVRVVSERIDTHLYESTVLAKAFQEITGMKVVHEITGEDDVVKKIQTQTLTGINLYDGYINDSDLIGTHFRSQKIFPISDFLSSEQEVTLPNLDIKDFIGISFTTGPDKIIYQLPDQQFANLYWYRADWFARPELKEQFKKLYGYELNIPENWSAYEDIADFFTNHVKTIDGVRIYGHMDYGKRDPSIGWRFSDAWLSMAGVGDKGLPNGLPIDEWGIRVEGCRPVGASVSRGGAANSPAAIYSLKKFDDWLKKFAPPAARNMNFSEAGAVPGQGTIAQQIFWYTAFTAALTKPGPVVNKDGTPKWRMAPSPHGAYWEKGMKLGYQDAGSWTFLKSTPRERRNAAWLYAQFLVSKTVSLKKTLVSLTPIRKSDVHSKVFSEMAPKLGGLVEFYQSEARNYWTPTGTNVPDYPLLSPGWWRTVPKVVNEGYSPKKAMDSLAEYLDNGLAVIEKKTNGKCSPRLNPKKPESYWINKPGSPKPKLNNEKPKGMTYDFETALKQYNK